VWLLYGIATVEIWDLPDWMTKTDYRILDGLADANVLAIQSPAVIAKNLGISRQYASRRLGELVDRGLVEKVEGGYYRITAAGKRELTSP